MALTLNGADAYIESYVINNDEWVSSDDSRKQRLLNVANRELQTAYGDGSELGLLIPDNAIYEFAGALSVAFSDVNKMQQEGVSGFSITGLGNFSFNGGGARELRDLIPQASLDIISKANTTDKKKIKLSGRSPIWTVI